MDELIQLQLDSQRQFQKEQNLLPFDKREIAINDDDVYRIGGTMVDFDSDEEYWANFILNQSH